MKNLQRGNVLDHGPRLASQLSVRNYSDCNDYPVNCTNYNGPRASGYPLRAVAHASGAARTDPRAKKVEPRALARGYTPKRGQGPCVVIGRFSIREPKTPLLLTRSIIPICASKPGPTIAVQQYSCKAA